MWKKYKRVDLDQIPPSPCHDCKTTNKHKLKFQGGSLIKECSECEKLSTYRAYLMTPEAISRNAVGGSTEEILSVSSEALGTTI